MELGFELGQELVHHPHDDFRIQRLEGNGGIEAVAELGREQALDLGHLVTHFTLGRETDDGLLHRLGAGVGGHDQDDVTEVGLPAVVVGQRAVIHHLQQDVVDVRVGFLDFIKEQHAVGLLVDLFGQEAALVKTDVARRGADQPRHGMAFHVFGHVEAHQFDAQRVGQLAGDFGLADAGRAAEQEGADRLLRVAEAGAGHLDRLGKGFDRRILAEDDVAQVAIKRLEGRAVVVGNVARRNAGDLGDDLLDLCFADELLLARLGQDSLGRTGFVDDVDGLVGQVTVVDVAG